MTILMKCFPEIYSQNQKNCLDNTQPTIVFVTSSMNSLSLVKFSGTLIARMNVILNSEIA